MSWKTLVDQGRLERHKTSKSELDELRLAIERNLRDASIVGLSADNRSGHRENTRPWSDRLREPPRPRPRRGRRRDGGASPPRPLRAASCRRSAFPAARSRRPPAPPAPAASPPLPALAPPPARR